MRPRHPHGGPSGWGEPAHPLEAVVSSLDDGLLVLDADGVVRFANPAACLLFGLESDQLIGVEFGHPVQRGLISEVDILGGREDPGVAQMRITATRWAGSDAFVAALRDVTDYKAQVDQLSDALAERNASVASASHELQNPLTSVRLAARLLVDHWEDIDDDGRERHLATILRNARRISLLMRNMLLRSRFEAGELRPETEAVDVAEAVLHVINDLEEQAVDIEADVAEGCVGEFDRDHLTQVLINLVTNAFKYGAPPIVITAYPVGDEVVVSVRDHGPGVSEEFVAHLFERFARADDTRAEQEGSGLGLSIVRIIAEANDATISYAPAREGGSEFTLRLARAR